MIDKLFGALGVRHPSTGEIDVILSLVVFVVVICGLKFLLDGVSIQVFGHMVSFGHVDSMSYGTMLAPTLGAHGYIATKGIAPTQSYNNQVDAPEDDQA